MFAAFGRLIRRKRRPKFQIELRLDRVEKYPFEELDLAAAWSFGKYKGRTQSAKVDLKQRAIWNEQFMLSSVKVEIDKRTCQPKEAVLRIGIYCGKVAVGKVAFDLTMFLSSRTWQSEKFALRKTGSNCEIVISVKATQIQGTPLFHTRPDLLPRQTNMNSPMATTDFCTIASIDPSLKSTLLDVKSSTLSLKSDLDSSPGSSPKVHTRIARHSSIGANLVDELMEDVLAQGETEHDLEEYKRTRLRSRMSSELLGGDSFRFNTI